MGFPVTAVLDNFNRTDSTTTIGANWACLCNFAGTHTDEGILTNQAYNPWPQFAAYILMNWITQYGPDCEAYITLATRPTRNSDDDPTIYARASNAGAPSTNNINGYDATIKDANTVLIHRNDNGVATLLGGAITQTVSSGDSIGIQCIGSTISAYYKASGGSWVNLGSQTDTTYFSVGYIGWYFMGNSTDGKYDDFGGGGVPHARFNNSGIRPRPFAPGFAR